MVDGEAVRVGKAASIQLLPRDGPVARVKVVGVLLTGNTQMQREGMRLPFLLWPTSFPKAALVARIK